jgi:flagellar protein FliS
MQSAEFSYRKTAVEGASGFGLLIALYETLAGNLRRAADAERLNKLEKRCSEINHALVVIGFLEDRIERATGGELAAQLTALYGSLRRKLIEAQAKRSPEILEQQLTRVLLIRESWQNMEHSRPNMMQYSLADAFVQENCGTPQLYAPSHRASWSA